MCAQKDSLLEDENLNMMGSRFTPLRDDFHEVRYDRKRPRHHTGTPPTSDHPNFDKFYKAWPTLNDFKSLSNDEKLTSIYDVMSTHLAPLKMRVDGVESHMYMNTARLDIVDNRLRLLEYKSIEHEVRVRSSNLVFAGIHENHDENCVIKIRQLLREKLYLDTDEVVIRRAFRVGRRKYIQGREIPRQIVVTFADPHDVELVIEKAPNLKGTKPNISINRDYPAEISEARKELWPLYKRARETHGVKNVKFKFPAAIEVKGSITHDKFPDWYPVLRGSRHENVQEQVSLSLKANIEKYTEFWSGHMKPTYQATNTPTNNINTSNVEIIESEPAQTTSQQNIDATVPCRSRSSTSPMTSHDAEIEPRRSSKHSGKTSAAKSSTVDKHHNPASKDGLLSNQPNYVTFSGSGLDSDN